MVPESELQWSFARSGGPGGQNVNKVSSKAILRWSVAATSAISDDVKIRLALQNKRLFTQDGDLLITSQRYRDQDRNREDCLQKLAAVLQQAMHVPTPRKATRPTRASKLRQLQAKQHRSKVKQRRRTPHQE